MVVAVVAAVAAAVVVVVVSREDYCRYPPWSSELTPVAVSVVLCLETTVPVGWAFNTNNFPRATLIYNETSLRVECSRPRD